MGKYDFTCGSCNKEINPEHLFTTDNRYECSSCGPICKDCVKTGMLTSNKCKGCGGSDLERQEIKNGRWGG